MNGNAKEVPMRELLAPLPLIILFVSSSAFAALKIENMHNTALQQEINQVAQVNFTGSLRMAQEIWAKKQETLYHSSLANLMDWSGKKVYDLISYALARENQRLTGAAKQEDSIVVPLSEMLILLEKTTNPDEDLREAKLLFSQALMLEEIRLYAHS
jgi:hypothetical protein